MGEVQAQLCEPTLSGPPSRKHPHLDLFPATPAQDLAATKREHVEWGAPGLSVDEFVAREAELGSCDFAQGGKRRRWVLAPVDDPTTPDGFFAACETDAICVFVRHQDRGNGYASQMVRLLHTKLARKGEEALPWHGAPMSGPLRWGAEPLDASDKGGPQGLDPYGLDADVSFLYSDVGRFYEPAGWRVMEHGQVEVTRERSATVRVPSEVTPLSETDLPSIAALDESQLHKDLSAPSAAPLRFRVSDPNAESWLWLVKRSKFFARLQRARKLRQDDGPTEPDQWGAQLATRADGSPVFTVWMYDWSGAKPSDWHLEVLRLRFTSIEELVLLLRSALTAAHRHGMAKVVIWNLEVQGGVLEQLQPLLEGAKVHLVSRDSSLPCLAVYGRRSSGDEVAATADGTEWLANEKGWWC